MLPSGLLSVKYNCNIGKGINVTANLGTIVVIQSENIV